MEDMEVLETHRRLSGRYHNACQLGRIMSAGGMIGTAILFPIAYADGLPFRALTISIFTLSLVVFTALHFESFIRIGQYTAPIALFILLIIVLFGAPSNGRDIIPWLPLYVVAACLLTVIIHKLPYRITRHQYAAVSQVYGSSDVALPPTAPYRSHRPSSDWSEPRPPSESYRQDPSSFHHMGPPSTRSVQTGSGGTEYTLSNIDGAARDPRAAYIFGNSHFDLGRLAAEHLSSTNTHTPDTYQTAATMEIGQARPSEDSTLESHVPLLGSYD
ncbi:hypothetical protein GE09DRAFT_1050542 [Coniochaeta sp. 2T2.1]|nr:hypothetical protein GE09DRAFT_1050542 [Coniochaeta sp. 2T2.1]